MGVGRGGGGAGWACPGKHRCAAAARRRLPSLFSSLCLSPGPSLALAIPKRPDAGCSLESSCHPAGLRTKTVPGRDTWVTHILFCLGGCPTPSCWVGRGLSGSPPYFLDKSPGGCPGLRGKGSPPSERRLRPAPRGELDLDPSTLAVKAEARSRAGRRAGTPGAPHRLCPLRRPSSVPRAPSPSPA